MLCEIENRMSEYSFGDLLAGLEITGFLDVWDTQNGNPGFLAGFPTGNPGIVG